MEDSNPELESFRRQWKAEVSAKARNDGNRATNAGPSKQHRRPAFNNLPSAGPVRTSIDNDDQEEPQRSLNFDGPNKAVGQDLDHKREDSQEPESALEHYEKAVERETQGNLGDSLNLYRKAFRMDHRVDQKYKTKHFPPSSFPSKPHQANPSNAHVTVPNPAHHSLDGPPQTITELIAGFSGLSIEPAPPFIEGTPAPPCPLAGLPDEILVHIFTEVAILDVASFVRLAQVCKKLAFLVSTEEQIWRRVCTGVEFGFRAMHYSWQREVLGEPLKNDDPESEASDEEGEEIQGFPLSNDEITESLFKAAYSSSWLKMFRLRPRIRFNGCYISTVNYMRPGQASPSQVSWNSPVHIVTYFRYLRFFRDGTVISLLSTTEPADVVHHLTKELQETHRGKNASYLPSAVMQQALRGRWRLSSIKDSPELSLNEAEGDVLVETEGANERYLYRMKLALRSSGKGVRNNKLVWQGFWNYNILTDDTGDFTLRNDKAFFFSRVKSYGMGV